MAAALEFLAPIHPFYVILVGEEVGMTSWDESEISHWVGRCICPWLFWVLFYVPLVWDPPKAQSAPNGQPRCTASKATTTCACAAQVWDLPNTAYLSSWLLLIITFGAMVCSYFFERRFWCRSVI